MNYKHLFHHCFFLTASLSVRLLFQCSVALPRVGLSRACRRRKSWLLLFITGSWHPAWTPPCSTNLWHWLSFGDSVQGHQVTLDGGKYSAAAQWCLMFWPNEGQGQANGLHFAKGNGWGEDGKEPVTWPKQILKMQPKSQKSNSWWQWWGK